MTVQSLDRYIETTPGVAGGKPHIAGHRITVQNIAVWHERLGRSADEICAEYGLSLAEVHAALAFYFDHREEIDRGIVSDDDFISELKDGHSSAMKRKLGAIGRG
jgi:uncharacterized protein (DUF433 family)